MIKKLQSIPQAAWIIVAVGILAITIALSVKILMSSNVSVNAGGINIETLATAEDEVVASPENVKAVEAAIAAEPPVEEKTKLHTIQQRQQQIQARQIQIDSPPHFKP